MESIRTFICFELPEEVRHHLRDLIIYLKTFGRGVRWVRHDGIHLTLKFLGSVEGNRIEEIAREVQAVSSSYQPFSIKLAGKGAFPNFNRPRVFWVGIDEPTGTIAAIQSDIEDRLATLGFKKEERKFSPHLTLGRVKFDDPSVRKIAGELQRMKMDQLEFSANEIVIMKSDLQPNGAVYTPLEKIPLKK